MCLFISNEKLRAENAIPLSFETFEISFISEKEVRGTLVEYEWALELIGGTRLSPEDAIKYWAYGRPVRKEAQQFVIKFMNCPTTA